MKKKCSLFIILVALLFPGTLPAKTISLPLTIDHALLRSLVLQTAFKDPNQTIMLADEAHRCWEISISEPRFSQEKNYIKFQSKLNIHASQYVFNRCLIPVDWEGYLILYQMPRIDSNWILSFDIKDSELYDRHHKPAALAGIAWNLVKEPVYTYLESITINLTPPVSELKSFVSPLFPPDLQVRADRLVNSMRPGKISTTQEAVQVEILADIEDVEVEDIDQKDLEPEKISKEELDRFIENWEAWDTYLVFIITLLTNEPLTEEDRKILMDVLLETRYRFITELTNETLNEDFVRDQFITAWKQLSPVFRRHLGDDPSNNLLGYLAFFTALDALAALDKIGPELGIEISRDGLIRLIQMISEIKEDILTYGIQVDKDLRKVLGLDPPLPFWNPVYEEESIEIDESVLGKIRSFFSQPAWAKETNRKKKGVSQWLFRGKDSNSYVERVKTLLKDVSKEHLTKTKLSGAYHPVFRLIVVSTAWQESCFRQFIIKKNKVAFLRSYNGTSVGLMQINERVWRGIYDQQHLRWDIRYNGMAGCEIIDIYFRKYALKKIGADKSIDTHKIAGLIYAMYNGGPGQLNKYLLRNKKGKYYLSDRLYSEKYTWVKTGQWDKIDRCLSGR